MNRTTRNTTPTDYRLLLLSKRSEALSRCPAKFDLLAQAGHVPDDDQVMLVHDEFVSIQSANLARQTLRQIDAALDRLDHGEYGICSDCGDDIAARRLQAIPWASRCIRCEERRTPPREFVAERRWAA